VEIPWDVVAVVFSIAASYGSLAYWLGGRFTRIDERLKRLEEGYKLLRDEVEATRRELLKRDEEVERRVLDRVEAVRQELPPSSLYLVPQ